MIRILNHTQNEFLIRITVQNNSQIVIEPANGRSLTSMYKENESNVYDKLSIQYGHLFVKLLFYEEMYRSAKKYLNLAWIPYHI